MTFRYTQLLMTTLLMTVLTLKHLATAEEGSQEQLQQVTQWLFLELVTGNISYVDILPSLVDGLYNCWFSSNTAGNTAAGGEAASYAVRYMLVLQQCVR